MSLTIHALIEQYGLFAIFAGCLFEGETAAILGGFFAHQGLFAAWAAFGVAAFAAFCGDCIFFLLGRRFASHRFVARLRQRPGFSHAFAAVRAHPNIFVLSNRFIYGLRLAGGVAAGLSDIAIPRFVALNALSALAWAGLFGALGYFFGLGAESLLGDTIRHHHRLLIALGIGIVSLVAGWWLTRHFGRKRAERDLR